MQQCPLKPVQPFRQSPLFMYYIISDPVVGRGEGLASCALIGRALSDRTDSTAAGSLTPRHAMFDERWLLQLKADV
ncbi:hypothetical protein Q8A67_025830 [Cirrhinus molitorella]|uniref:Uncharacterized protein n=1 Tax=Cirrhinus molitorella TaxID=172907 RepID=A0AA88P0C8_9TELE|nr:hypothetical protein Q8A67_025830 [Cirrhinus molitorella]